MAQTHLAAAQCYANQWLASSLLRVFRPSTIQVKVPNGRLPSSWVDCVPTVYSCLDTWKSLAKAFPHHDARATSGPPHQPAFVCRNRMKLSYLHGHHINRYLMLRHQPEQVGLGWAFGTPLPTCPLYPGVCVLFCRLSKAKEFTPSSNSPLQAPPMNWKA